MKGCVLFDIYPPCNFYIQAMPRKEATHPRCKHSTILVLMGRLEVVLERSVSFREAF